MGKRLWQDWKAKLAPPYERGETDTAPFQCIKQYLRYPPRFECGEWIPIAELPKKTTEDRNVRVFESRYPARFFRVVVPPDGDRPGLVYESGSGLRMAQLAAEVAVAYHENLPLTENDLSRRMAMAAAVHVHL